MSPEDMTILLVDDEPDIVDATSVAFELVDFNVITANGGREAWDILNKKTVDLIITDVRMPDGTGLELLDNVKSKNLYFPEVILTTGYADFSVEEIFEKGADGLFWKPFDTKAIIKEVENRLLSESELLSVEPSSAPSRQISLQIDSINEVGSTSKIKFARGGFYCSMEKDFPENGSLLNFEIAIEDSNPVSKLLGVGKVRWIRNERGALPLGIGVEVLYLESNCRKPYLDYIKSQNIKAYIPR